MKKAPRIYGAFESYGAEGLSFLGAEELGGDVDDPASDGQKAESVEGDREKSDPDGEGAQDGQQEFYTQEGTD